MHSLTIFLLPLLLALLSFHPSQSHALPSILRTSTSCPTHCPRGQICAGTRRQKRCVPARRLGQSCGRNPYRVCRAGLTCEVHTCRGRFVPLDGRCSKKGMRCRRGLVCAGTAEVKKCVKPMPVGGKCAKDPFWVCRVGLVCKGGVCQYERVPKGGSCRFKGSVCDKGLVCSGTEANPRCVMPMKKGQKCKRGDPYWVCEDGLVCSGSKDNPRCVMPMKKGEACRKGDPYWICVDGLKCVGPKGGQRCEMPMKKGQNCRKADPFWICEEGLKCEAGKCTEED